MPMEMLINTKELKLTVKEQNEINRRVAKSGVWERLGQKLDSEDFNDLVRNWQNHTTPEPRKKPSGTQTSPG